MRKVLPNEVSGEVSVTPAFAARMRQQRPRLGHPVNGHARIQSLAAHGGKCRGIGPRLDHFARATARVHVAGRGAARPADVAGGSWSRPLTLVRLSVRVPRCLCGPTERLRQKKSRRGSSSAASFQHRAVRPQPKNWLRRTTTANRRTLPPALVSVNPKIETGGEFSLSGTAVGVGSSRANGRTGRPESSGKGE